MKAGFTNIELRQNPPMESDKSSPHPTSIIFILITPTLLAFKWSPHPHQAVSLKNMREIFKA
jgi:hypothetical protein